MKIRNFHFSFHFSLPKKMPNWHIKERISALWNRRKKHAEEASVSTSIRTPCFKAVVDEASTTKQVSTTDPEYPQTPRSPNPFIPGTILCTE